MKHGRPCSLEDYARDLKSGLSLNPDSATYCYMPRVGYLPSLASVSCHRDITTAYSPQAGHQSVVSGGNTGL